MTDRLIVFEDKHIYRIGWECEGDIGAVLGEDDEDGTGKPPTDRKEWEDWIATKMARETGAEKGRSGSSMYSGFYWESSRAANAVLRTIKLAFKNGDRELPEWAKTAIAAGWKPPKGWKP